MLNKLQTLILTFRGSDQKRLGLRQSIGDRIFLFLFLLAEAAAEPEELCLMVMTS